MALRKEARAFYLDEKMHLQVLNEMEIAYKVLDLISYRYAIFDADRSNKENHEKLAKTLEESMIDGHKYFCWVNEKLKNGHKFDEDTITRNFTIMLINYQYNKSMYRHPQLKENYSKSLKIMMGTYGYLKEIHQKYCDANSDFEVDDDDAETEQDKKDDGGKMEKAGCEKMDVAGPSGDAL